MLVRFRRAVIALVAACGVAVLSVPGAAWAHAAMVGSDPTAGSVVESVPSQVSVTFNEPLQDQFSALTVVGPDGELWSGDDVVVDDRSVVVSTTSGGPAGTYTIAYRVISADSHPVSGTIEFTVSGDNSVEDTPAITESTDALDNSESSLPVWPFVAGVLVLVGIGIAVVARAATRRN
ncbi:copper resistance protein CopC [Hoyosella rhizosphaerae]|uniref:Copper resistance protein C n=1 Tax=Hoyosella rhizosphaerae TaxID=1755582 RepID=A0A916U933_9ACTN|nr:copper resistance CopC family protein [Hoyosella rhizosphaerae]MBN4927439.1 copper resistance protein CopC [Hoyosella rhizosphaerae]GGC64369.1 copper resistance protein C [Hoyosella rhizosphaerae]